MAATALVIGNMIGSGTFLLARVLLGASTHRRNSPVKDAARFALAIAAILSATALDAQQSGTSQSSFETESGMVTGRSGQPDDPAPAKPGSGDGYISSSEPSGNIARARVVDLDR